MEDDSRFKSEVIHMSQFSALYELIHSSSIPLLIWTSDKLNSDNTILIWHAVVDTLSIAIFLFYIITALLHYPITFNQQITYSLKLPLFLSQKTETVFLAKSTWCNTTTNISEVWLCVTERVSRWYVTDKLKNV